MKQVLVSFSFALGLLVMATPQAIGQTWADSLAAGLEISNGHDTAFLRITRGKHVDQPGVTAYVKNEDGVYVPMAAAGGVTVEVTSAREVEVQDSTGRALEGIPTMRNTTTGIFEFHLSSEYAADQLKLAILSSGPPFPTISFVPLNLKER